jgi:hypothetical protein
LVSHFIGTANDPVKKYKLHTEVIIEAYYAYRN